MTFETYTLILKHCFEENGEIVQIEDPLVVKYCTDRMIGSVPILINRMFDEMKHEALKRLS